VNLAARLEGLSTGADVIISRAVYDDPNVRTMIDSAGLSTVEFDMALKGFEDQRFELWRVSAKNG
jgi:class 3 adenylate cyclase